MLDKSEVLDVVLGAGDDVRRQFKSMSEDEKNLVLSALSDSSIYNLLLDIDFKEDPVSPRRFFSDPYYVGKGSIWDESEKSGIFPKWKEELCYVLDPKNEIYEWVLSGCLGAGKTQAALYACMYRIYWLNCLRFPHKYLGIGANSSAEFFLLTVNLNTASDILIDRFESLILGSPYFRDSFPVNKRRRVAKTSGKGNGIGDYKLEFPPHFSVIEGSGDMHFISRDVITALMDEANFLEKSKKGMTRTNYSTESRGYSLYVSLRNRILSRFLKRGKMLGFMCLISSAASDNMFLEQHKKRARKDPHAHISEFALYEIQPWKFDFSKTFTVFVGGKGVSSRILKEGDQEPDAAGSTIEVPISLLPTYEKDLPQALREFSGISTDVSHPFIKVKEQIYERVDTNIPHPFMERVDDSQNFTGIVAGHLSEGNEILDSFDPGKLSKWDGSRRVPKLNRSASRFIHVDLAISGCAVGMSMGHISEVMISRIQDKSGNTVSIKVPVIYMDFVLRLLPPSPPEHHGYFKIRSFITYLRDTLNFTISKVSYDGYQSEDSVQLLQRAGFQAEKLSVDSKSGPYESLASAISEDRIKYYYYQPLIDELESLQELNDGNRTYIDHIPGGSKDVSDTVAGVAHHCAEHVSVFDNPLTHEDSVLKEDRRFIKSTTAGVLEIV